MYLVYMHVQAEYVLEVKILILKNIDRKPKYAF